MRSQHRRTHSRTQSSSDTPDQVRKKKIRSSSGAPENQDGGRVGNQAPHCRNNKVLRPGDAISTARYLKLKQWGSGDPYSHTKREARSSSVNVSGEGAEPGGPKIQGGICTGASGHTETPRTWRRRSPLGALIPTRLGACSHDKDLHEQVRSIHG
ncbi:hypothetical protein NDU88_001619 [Pleurodeles waltl]|uniref:Uncharacterized protein n=1 Tax=Pleurodeles waltl TaxID=8319 RepID=A0AAV7KTC9_PLEWA|nr:hypothetical protein NDU88_001619 [Pleurodeles waltl]